jgi:hypothetical protein
MHDCRPANPVAPPALPPSPPPNLAPQKDTKHHMTPPLYLFLHAGVALATTTTRSHRICRPAPPRVVAAADDDDGGLLPVCLVVGDSVSLGYTGDLTALLKGTCSVVHAPFSGDGGACDTNYALQCAELWLNSTLSGAAARPEYAAVVFNFGLHDTNDSGEPEESRDEFVPLEQYGENLVTFVGKIRQMQQRAKIGWLASTPMHFNMHLNDNVIAYNKLAQANLVTSKMVDSSLDLYASVVSQCKTPPCKCGSLMRSLCCDSSAIILQLTSHHLPD